MTSFDHNRMLGAAHRQGSGGRIIRRSSGIGRALALVVALGLAPASAGAQGDCERDPERYDPDASIVFVERDPVESRCYYCSNTLSDEHLASLLYVTLVKPEPDTREPMASLATSWEIDRSARSITFRLAPNYRWASGEAITNADVMATFWGLRSPRSCVRQAYREFAYGIARIELLDDDGVRFRFREAGDVSMSAFYRYPILPASLLNEYGFDASAPLCTGEQGTSSASGPYVLDSFTGLDPIFAANPDYRGGNCEPYIERLRMHVVGDRSSWPSLLETRAVDLLIDVPVRYTLRYLNDRNFKTKVYGFLSCVFVAFNFERDVFDDRRVRQAMIYAYDRDRILRSTFSGRGEVLAGPLGTSSRYFNRDVIPRPYSTAKANELLDVAGITDSDGDGLREWGGADLRLELLVAQSLFIEYEPAIEFYRAAMRAIGIEVETRLVDDNRFEELRAAGAFDLLWGRWEFIDGISVFRAFESEHDDNFMHYRDDEYDRIIERARKTDDVMAYSQFLRSAQERLHDESAATFLFSLDHMAVHLSRIKSLRVSAYNFFDYIDEAYVDEE